MKPQVTVQIPWKGYIQLTGKSNYTRFSQFIGEDCIATWVGSFKISYCFRCIFFQSNKLWAICDKGADVATVTAVSTAVNGKIPWCSRENPVLQRIMQALS